MEEGSFHRKKKISYSIAYKKNVLIKFKGKVPDRSSWKLASLEVLSVGMNKRLVSWKQSGRKRSQV